MGQAIEFGDVVRQWRRARKLSQEELALRACLSTRHMSFLETGRAKPSLASAKRIADALELTSSERAFLHASAISSPTCPEDQRPLLELVLDTTLAVDEAGTSEAIVAAATPVLWQLGFDRFFLATVSAGNRDLTFDEVATFPVAWANNYRNLAYARHDPLVAEACAGRSGFYWSDVLPGRNVPEPARRMFASAGNQGARSGFVAALPGTAGRTSIISMMGTGQAEETPRLRLALRTLGWSAINRLAQLGADQ